MLFTKRILLIMRMKKYTMIGCQPGMHTIILPTSNHPSRIFRFNLEKVIHNVYSTFPLRFLRIIDLREEALLYARKTNQDFIFFVDADNMLKERDGKANIIVRVLN